MPTNKDGGSTLCSGQVSPLFLLPLATPRPCSPRLVSLLDEFAYRFYQELDYNLECENGIRIKEDMKILPMVVIPGNFPEYTSRRVHVAEWIEGEKLSQSTADDVGALVNLGVITYLTQLLDKGLFHAVRKISNQL
jgi:aarF domain-containing kinase